MVFWFLEVQAIIILSTVIKPCFFPIGFIFFALIDILPRLSSRIFKNNILKWMLHAVSAFLEIVVVVVLINVRSGSGDSPEHFP